MTDAGADRSTVARDRPLTVGIDARAAVEVGAGRGRVVRELLRALGERRDPHTYLCFARTPWRAELGPDIRWITIPDRDPIWHAHAARVASRRCDVFLSTNSYITPLFLTIPSVTIVYDLVTFEASMRPNRRSTVIERLTLGPAVRRSSAMLCISEATAEALRGRFPQATDRTTVSLLGVSPALEGEGESPGDLPAPGFALAVGTLEPRKNLPRLIRAYASLPDPLQAAHPLVVVGAEGWEVGETTAAMRSLGDRCIRLGRVADATLGALYARCGVFCYPSLGEGFGLPVLEAMQAGAPVVTSSISSLPEVGGDAVEYVDPFSVPSIAAGLRRVLTEPIRADALRAAGPRRAAAFSWAGFAESTLRTLERAASRGI